MLSGAIVTSQAVLDHLDVASFKYKITFSQGSATDLQKSIWLLDYWVQYDYKFCEVNFLNCFFFYPVSDFRHSAIILTLFGSPSGEPMFSVCCKWRKFAGYCKVT